MILNIQKILFLYCGGTTYPISTEDALCVYIKNIYFNKEIIFKNKKITISGHYSPFAKIDILTKTHAEYQI